MLLCNSLANAEGGRAKKIAQYNLSLQTFPKHTHAHNSSELILLLLLSLLFLLLTSLLIYSNEKKNMKMNIEFFQLFWGPAPHKANKTHNWIIILDLTWNLEKWGRDFREIFVVRDILLIESEFMNKIEFIFGAFLYWRYKELPTQNPNGFAAFLFELMGFRVTIFNVLFL